MQLLIVIYDLVKAAIISYRDKTVAIKPNNTTDIELINPDYSNYSREIVETSAFDLQLHSKHTDTFPNSSKERSKIQTPEKKILPFEKSNSLAQ